MSKGTKSRLTIRHKADECVGCNYCAEVIPQYFELDDEGLAILLNGEKRGIYYHAEALSIDVQDIRDAVEGCSTSIIFVDEK
jgi:ferredoxin|tara:strand:+ start:2436 stop:2681 length:246 start_codon:yes stop_codon:yes gene_type:complete